MKMPAAKDSASQELRRLEQETVKAAGSQKSAPRQHVAPVKAEREKANPPIRFSSASSGQGGAGPQAKNKERVRQKGSSKH